MILVRQVFQAKYGHGDALVAILKELRERVPPEGKYRIMTDASGPFFTVVTEAELPSLAAWEQYFQGGARNEEDDGWFQDWFQRMMPLVDSGSRTFYNIVE